ncbi:MAG: DegT/DnrJ/EryC1/StrS family aminotransferase [Flavobacteriales bacterium]|nr:DegT/DnrJ/EryC1/StrS family aminotransferase [Flavobacteriales bacterium]MCB9364764.1 DegT/DnrJ/EryC1/StrS family aminotransferase [Flavobacteriales bacterium]
MILVNEPDLNGNELKYLTECIKTNWISCEGSFVKKFESEFAKTVNRKFGIALTSGSTALDLALHSLALSKNDEVIVPSFTIISPVASIIRTGATPVLIDSNLETWNMNVEDIERKITPKTKAIIIVHIYGLPVDIDPVIQLAKKYNLIIIEDAAEMHGQTYKGKPCGSFGDISIFSFYPNKHITTGEGGMIVTNDIEIANKINSLKNLCFVPERRFVHYELGWNARFTNLQAAIGLAQLERLDIFIKRKREMGKYYTKKLSHLKSISLPLESTTYAENIYWVFGILIKPECKLTANDVIKKLAEKNIQTRPFFYPMHLQPVFTKMKLFKNEEYKNSEIMANKGFYIPSGLNLTYQQMDIVIEALEDIFA